MDVPNAGFVATFPLNAKYSDGSDAPYESVLVGVSDEALASIEWDGLIRVTPLGPTGPLTITTRIDVLIGGGERLLTATKEINIVEAVTLSIGDGTLEPIPAP